METTYPSEFEELKQYLQKLSDDQKRQIEDIVLIHLKWDMEMKEAHSGSEGKIMTTKEDSPENGSSMGNYLRAELATFSLHTLQLFEQETKEAFENGENLLMETIKNETAFYEYYNYLMMYKIKNEVFFLLRCVSGFSKNC